MSFQISVAEKKAAFLEAVYRGRRESKEICYLSTNKVTNMKVFETLSGDKLSNTKENHKPTPMRKLFSGSQ